MACGTSPTRDQTRTPCSGSAASSPLVHQGSPRVDFHQELYRAFYSSSLISLSPLYRGWIGLRIKYLFLPWNKIVKLDSRSHLVKSESRSVVSDYLRPYGPYSPWNSPGQNTGVGSHFLLQGISPTQGSNPGLLYCKRTLYQLSHKGNPPGGNNIFKSELVEVGWGGVQTYVYPWLIQVDVWQKPQYCKAIIL